MPHLRLQDRSGRSGRSALLPAALLLGLVLASGMASATQRAVLGELFSADG